MIAAGVIAVLTGLLPLSILHSELAQMDLYIVVSYFAWFFWLAALHRLRWLKDPLARSPGWIFAISTLVNVICLLIALFPQMLLSIVLACIPRTLGPIFHGVDSAFQCMMTTFCLGCLFPLVTAPIIVRMSSTVKIAFWTTITLMFAILAPSLSCLIYLQAELAKKIQLDSTVGPMQWTFCLLQGVGVLSCCAALWRIGSEPEVWNGLMAQTEIITPSADAGGS
ncbi:MAG TPA: hypothetical protein V6C81_23300 [Planktothrix sp.]